MQEEVDWRESDEIRVNGCEAATGNLHPFLHYWVAALWKKRFLSSAFKWFSLLLKFKRAITQTNLISWWEVVYIYPHFHTCDSVSKIAGFPQVMQQWKANKQIRCIYFIAYFWEYLFQKQPEFTLRMFKKKYTEK